MPDQRLVSDLGAIEGNPQEGNPTFGISEQDKNLINKFLESTNIAEELDQDFLDALGKKVIEEYKIDDESRSNWIKKNEDYIKLATQMVEGKNTPWPNASNIKYPLVTVAALQFQARAYPALVSEPTPVKAKVIGEDPTGEKQESAKRVSLHMSYQVLEEMDEWEEDMDKLTFILPILGTAFKKTFYSPIKKKNVSQLVMPHDLVVNYWAKSLKDAKRLTHILELQENDIQERINRGIFSDIDLGPMPESLRHTANIMDQKHGITQPTDDPDTPRQVLEQHRWEDLDEDGYKEPYIVTVDFATSKVLRVIPNYHVDTIETDPDTGKVIAIKPLEYFTKYSFIPSPDGGFYDLGFGALIGPLNKSANTIINQLIDSGTLANLPSGFIARGIRIKGGSKQIKPGQWVPTVSTGDDLKKGIVPLPVKEPSQTLFQLLGTILESGQSISAISDVMLGVNPGQNQPATTTMAVLEQGAKVFSAIHKRNFRSLKLEYKKLYELNKRYLKEKDYFLVLDSKETAEGTIFRRDYIDNQLDIRPSADPKVVTDAQKLIKAQGLMELMSGGFPVNVQESTKRILEAQEQPNIELLMEPNPAPQPSLETQLELRKQEHQEALDREKMEIERIKVQNEAVKDEAVAELQIAKAQGERVERTLNVVREELNQLHNMAQDKAEDQTSDETSEDTQ